MSLSLPKASVDEAGSGASSLAGSVLSWVRAMSLDAPLVALCWQALIAESVGAALRPVHVFTLFAATWLAYSGDRLLDGLRLEGQRFAPTRHRVAIRHRRVLAGAWSLVALTGGGYALAALDARSRVAGLALLGLVALYFAASHLAPGRVRRGLPREVMVSVIFSIAVALFPLVLAGPVQAGRALVHVAVLPLAAFMNLWAVACWEREEDELRGEITLVSGRPGLARAFAPVCLVLGFALLATTLMVTPSREALALALSSLALAALHPLDLSADVKPLFADAALLSPLLVLS